MEPTLRSMARISAMSATKRTRSQSFGILNTSHSNLAPPHGMWYEWWPFDPKPFPQTTNAYLGRLDTDKVSSANIRLRCLESDRKHLKRCQHDPLDLFLWLSSYDTWHHPYSCKKLMISSHGKFSVVSCSFILIVVLLVYVWSVKESTFLRWIS